MATRKNSNMPSLDELLAQPLVAHLANTGANGPVVRPIWFLWEADAFWWLTGTWSTLVAQLQDDSRVALVIDTCDLATGQVLQVTTRGEATVVQMDRALAIRKLTKYLGDDTSRWGERFTQPLDDAGSRLVRLAPSRPLVVRDLSFEPPGTSTASPDA